MWNISVDILNAARRAPATTTNAQSISGGGKRGTQDYDYNQVARSAEAERCEKHAENAKMCVYVCRE